MEYKIGDVVRIKDNLQVGEKYGGCNVIDDMLKYRGMVDTIEYIDDDGDFELASEDNAFAWNKDMVELIKQTKHISDLKSVKMDRLGIYEYILNHLEETYEAKNNDYGNSVADTYDKFGSVSFLVRITDKYNRLMTLCDPNAPEQKVKDEKIDDTILDLANYCLLWLVEREYKINKEECKVDKTTLIIAGIDIGIGIIELMCGEILLGMGMIILGFLLIVIK